MPKKITPKRFLLFLALFFFLSVIKLHNYDRWPGPAHAEELLYGWSGLSLIKEGVPMSWSTLNYPDEYKIYDGKVGDPDGIWIFAKLYRPWLDEPPLYSLIVGSISNYFGDDLSSVLPTSHTRIPTVLLSILMMFLIFWVAYKYFGYAAGLLAMAFYGTSPIMVFGSRLSVPENFISFFLLLIFISAFRYLRKPSIMFPLLAGILSAIAGLMKPTGFFLAPLVIFLCLRKRRWKDALLTLFLTLAGVVLFAVYAYQYDWNLFLTILKTQAIRFAGWSSLGYVFTTPAHDIYEIIDGWYIFALVSFLFYALRKGNNGIIKLMLLFTFYWFLVVVFSSSEQDLLPWYRYPIYPFLAIFGALGIIKIYNNPNFFGSALVVGLLLSSRFLLKNAFRDTTPPNTFRFVFIFLISPSLLYYLRKSKLLLRLSKAAIISVFALGFYLNSRYVYSAFETRCENVPTCSVGPSTTLSEVRMPFLWRFLIIRDYNRPDVINPPF